MKSYKWLWCILIVLSMFVAGFLIGRYSIKPQTITKTEYVKGDTIESIIEVEVPVKEYYPVDTTDIIKQCVKDGVYVHLFPKIIDTQYVIQEVDTLKILADWATKREYQETLFDADTLGTCKVKMDVQYNRLYNIEYSYTPTQKVITNTITQIKRFEPFVSFGVLSQPSVLGEVGFYAKEHYGISGLYQYDTSLKKHYFGGKISYKF